MSRSSHVRRFTLALLAVAMAAAGIQRTAAQVVPGTNVNMVSGTGWPDGDPYLQRQNEPSSAVSTRNPLHILAGANDYRTVDLPGPFDPLRGERNNADAWVGLFKSFDGGQTWRSTLVPGYPQDASPEGLASPLHGRQAATDPVVRAGTNGLFYYAGLAFDRGENAPSTIFVARFVDLNNLEAGDPISYIDTRVVDSDGGTRFLDKTALAVDVPRGTATCTITAPLGDGSFDTRTIPAGNVYVAYTAFTGSGATQTSRIMFSRSTNCGETWSTPRALSIGDRLVQNAQIAVSPVDGAVYVSWRRFRSGAQDDSLFVAKSTNGGATFLRQVRVAPVRPFDQGTTGTSFRTNAFQTMTVDATGRVYVAWAQRGHSAIHPDPVTGDAKIVVSSSTNGNYWSAPAPVDASQPGHQLMPSLSFHAGRLQLLYYDLREDVSQVFAPFVDDFDILLVPPTPRHTIDVFVAQALPAAQPVFTSVRLSDYATGYFPGSDTPQRLQYNPPNLPLFRQGTAPFMGDYIDLAPAPPFVQRPDGVWIYNTAPSTAPISHGFWTDNRDVRAPRDGNWQNYTPVVSEALGTESRFDPTQMVPPCAVGQTGMRNQNIYTSRITQGLFAGSPGNSKPLGIIPRTFVVLAQNASAVVRSYRLTIDNQPPNGYASFLQVFTPGATPLTVLDISIPPLSSVSRSVFVSSTDPAARVTVTLAEISAPGAPAPIAGGLTTSVVLNADPTNPRLENPRLENTGLPDIDDAEVYNPDITTAIIAIPRLENPRLENPTMEAPRLENEGVETPRLENDAVANPTIINPATTTTEEAPRLENPRLENPRLENVDLTNAGISDTSWVIENEGNTTASYTINLISNSPLPTGFTAQLVLHQVRLTPSAQDCTLAEQPDLILLANITDPQFVPLAEATNPRLENPRLENATLALAPGETAIVTLRVVDPNRFDGVTFDAGAAVTPATVAHAVNTEDAANGITQPPVAIPLTITTADLAPTAPGAPYNVVLSSFAGSGNTTWEVSEGSLPPGLTLDPSTGVISGTPTTPGNYEFTVRSTDANGNTDTQVLSIQVNPTVPGGFNRLWNGVSSDWFDPRNWSPNGVPLPADSVYVPASISTSPQLTRDATVHHLFVENGATLDTNGFTLTASGNATAGNTIVGEGTTVLTGVGVTASGVFSNLRIVGQVALIGPLTVTGDLTMVTGSRLVLVGQNASVTGQLRTTGAGSLPVIANGVLAVGGVDVQGLVLDSVPLVVNGGQLTRFDTVLFTGYLPTDVRLTVNHSGSATPLSFGGLSFFSAPTTGAYISANDTVDDAQDLVINISGAVPADGSSRTLTSGGAVVNWLFEDGANLGVALFQSATDPITYTAVVVNGGPQAAANAVLTFTAPAGATVSSAVSTLGTCDPGGSQAICAFGDMGAGAFATVTIVVSAAGDGLSLAQVSSSTLDPVPGNNTHALSLPATPSTGVNLSLTKSDSIDPVSPNTPFTYTLTVTNGSTPAPDVVLIDTLPAGITASSASATIGTCAIAAQQVLCDLGNLAAAQAATVSITASASASGLVTNVAAVTSLAPELSPADNVAAEQTMVAATAQCSAVTFTGPTSYQGSPGPTAVVRLVDMDHDGNLDAVATHEINGGGVDVFLNDGTGQFAPPRFTSTVTGPWIHVVADFNGDTHPDVITSSDREPGAESITLRLLTNDGTGTLTLVPGFSIPFGGHLDAQDLDRDGDMDLVIASATSDDLELLRNDGAGNFALPVTLVAGRSSFPAFGDLNGDGHTDIVLPAGAAGYEVVLADGEGGYLPPVVHAVAGGAYVVSSPVDLNGDGHLDLLITEGDEDAPTGQASVALGDGVGGFSASIPVASGSFLFYFAALTDVNGDGRVDLVGISSANSFAVWLGDGAGGFSTPVHFPNATYYWPTVGDVNADGRPDIVTGDRYGQLNVFLNNCSAAPVNLGVGVSESADPVNEGDELTYTVTVTNQTAVEATGLRLRSVLAPEIADEPEEPNVAVLEVTSSAGGTLSTIGSTYTWTLPTLGPNSTATFTFRFRTLGGATLLFTSGVTSDGAETDPSDNTASASTTVTAVGRTLAVTTTNDSGPGSLRQAIVESNDPGDVDTITFNIGAGGPQTIVPLSPLPAITQPAIIDGTTQPGFAGAPIIELNGNGLNDNGLFITDNGGNTTIRGLVINRFGQNGVLIIGAGGNVIEGSYIGLDLSGTAAQPNRIGVAILFSAGNRIGGTTAAARNVVSGNQLSGVSIEGAAATGNVVQGNFIGTNAAGTAGIANGGGIFFSNGAAANTIGGTAADARNVISGNTGSGITLQSSGSGSVVLGNYIGTNASGTAALPNSQQGINLSSVFNVTIGGTQAGAGNVVSGNAGAGIVVGQSFAVQIQGNRIGTNAAGTAPVPNANNGVVITSSDGTSLGGIDPGAGNLISGNTLDGVSVGGSGEQNTIRGNLIGTDALGTAPLGNRRGIVISAEDTTVGGTTAAARNVVSGNHSDGVVIQGVFADGTIVQGNYIGTDITGTAALPNASNGIAISNAPSSIIGGAAAGAGNLISGNAGIGVLINNGSTGTVVQGNLVGLNAAGTASLGNGGPGLSVFDVAGAIVGGTTAAARNVVSGNGGNGISLNVGATGTMILGNYIGTDVTGALAVPNQNHGITLMGGASGNSVGAEGGANVIAGNGLDGVSIVDATTTANTVAGNLIGTNAAGTAALGNRHGVAIFNSPGNVIGGTTVGARNVISGNNADGIAMSGATASGNTIQGNYIGTDAAGAAGLGNAGPGVWIFNGANNNIIGRTLTGTGAGNVIAGNSGSGVVVQSAGTVNNTIFGNSIHSNGVLGIDLDGNGATANDSGDGDTGPNNLQNYPVLTSAVSTATATTVNVTFDSIAGRVYTIEFFRNDACDASGSGEGAVLIGTSVINPAQTVTQFTADFAPFPVGTAITATATSADGTSEFSACALVTGQTAPIANAGPDQSVTAGATVQLDGTASSDPDDDPLSYDWAFISVPTGSAATLANPTTATPTFVADVPGTFVARLVVSDATSSSAPDIVEIHTNGPPVADAGDDQVVLVGGLVQLDGSGSFDPEGLPLTYTWILNTRPAGSAAQLSNPNIANPTFVADVRGTYIAQLIVNDGLVNSESDTVTISTLNNYPIANAGPDQSSIPLQGTVTLDGSGSSDPDGDPITYSWSFDFRPAGSSATLVDANTASPTFVADTNGRYRIRLNVNDGLLSSTDTVDVTTVNQPPIANAGGDQNVFTGTTVFLNGSGSFDPDSTPLSYAWTIISRPEGSTAQLSNGAIVNPTLTPDLDGQYVARLVVNDGIADSAADDVTITAVSSSIVLGLVDTGLIGLARDAMLRVTLPLAAPAGGVTVTIASGNDAIVSVAAPGTILIAEGESVGQISLHGEAVGTTTVRATTPGYSDGELTVTVTNNVLTVPTSVDVPFGQSASLPVTLPVPAPPGGLSVTITSSDSSIIEVLTPTVTVPEGASGVNAAVRGASFGTATVTASRADYSSASAQVASTGALRILPDQTTFTPGLPTSAVIRLESGGSPTAAPAPGVTVTLETSNPACLVATTPVTIATGLISTTTQVTYGGTAALPCTATLTATSGGLTPHAVSFTVNPNAGITLFGLPSSVGAGLQDSTYTARLGAFNHGGVTMRIASSNPDMVRVSRFATSPGASFIDVFVPNGSTDVTYVVHAIEGTSGAATLTATAPGFNDGSGTVNVVQPFMDLQGVPANTTTLSLNSPFYVRVGVSSTGTFLTQVQAVRIGSSVEVTITHTNPAVAQLTTASGSGQTRTVTIAGGSYFSPTSGASTGGIDFDPIAAGTTTVSASAAGFTSLNTSTAEVSAPGITLFSLPTSVGAGLQDGIYTVRLGGSSHGGVTVRIASGNQNAARVSRNAGTAGSEFIDIFVPNGSTDVSYYIHGMEGASGAATITASAPGFGDAQGTVNIVQPFMDLQGLPADTTTLSPSSPFYVRVGLSSTGTFLTQVQPVRFGSSLEVTLTHTNPAVAQLTTAAGSGQTRTVTIPGGSYFSPTSGAASGGIEFDPLAEGTTTVSASAAGFTVLNTATVNVSASGITLFSLPASVGAGLQDGLYVARLGGSNHGGVTVTLTSSDASIARLSTDATTGGTASIDVLVPNGSTDVYYYIHGIATGSATITASAERFSAANGTVNVVQPWFDIQGLPATTTSLSANSAFYARVGLSSTGTFLTQVQAVRAGTSLTVTFTHTNPTVAQLTTLAGSAQVRTVAIQSGFYNSPAGGAAAGGIEFDPLAGGSTTVSASIPGFQALNTSTVTITAADIQLFGFPATIGAGLQDGYYVARLGGPNHGGTTVTLSTSNTAVLRVAPDGTTVATASIDVFVPDGSTDAYFYLAGVEGAAGGVTVSAVAPGFTDARGTVNVVPPWLDLQGVPASTTTLSPDAPIYARAGLSSTGAFLTQVQSIRAGSSLEVTFSNSNPSVAELVTAAGAGQVRTATILAGFYYSPTSVATGGVAFRALAGGSTSVSASAPGFQLVSPVPVTVTGPAVALVTLPGVVGAGLQDGPHYARLSASGHGGVTVRIQSSVPTLALVSANANTAGTEFVDIFVPAGQTDTIFYVHGMEGTTGSATITATAAGFDPASAGLDVVAAALQIEGLNTTIFATDPSDEFVVRVGVPYPTGQFVWAYQAVRTGASPMIVTLTTADVDVAQLVTLAGGAQERTITIAPGQFTSPFTVAGGGIALDPLTEGTTAVTATSPGVITTGAGTVIVQVTGG